MHEYSIINDSQETQKVLDYKTGAVYFLDADLGATAW